jgi:hypothetical protein
MVHDPESGRSWYIDPANPEHSKITAGMLAHGLKAQRRFHGFTTREITTAEHCLRVARFARAIVDMTAPIGFVARRAAYLGGLLHDAAEPVTWWGDCLGPGKTDYMRAVEARLDEVILEALAPSDSHAIIAEAILVETMAIKTADLAALYYEGMLWQPSAADWVPEIGETIGIAGLHEVLLPLVWPRPGEDWLSSVRETIGGQRDWER